MLFVSFTKGPGGFSYVFIITGKVPILIVLTKAQNLAIREPKKDRDCIVLTAGKGWQ